MVAQESVQINSNGKRVTHRSKWPEWHQELAAFRNSDAKKAVWQLVNTLVPYAALWYLMIRSIQLGYPYALTLALALPAAAFLVRLFILFHDCVHDSFFKSKRAQHVLRLCSRGAGVHLV